MLVCPTGIAPAARRRATGGASDVATRPRSRSAPCVVGTPSMPMLSFTVNGTPVSGPVSSPAARRRSVPAASARARSASSWVIAFTSGLTVAIRSRWLSTSSAADTSPERTSSACSVAGRAQSAFSMIPTSFRCKCIAS